MKTWRDHVRRRLWFLFGHCDAGREVVQGTALRALLDRACSHSRSRAPRRVLNAGGGDGLYSAMLLAIAGLERLVEMDIRYASARRARPQQSFVAASLTAIPARAAAFDLILCSEVLEHIREDSLALDELRRVLAPGGQMLVTVPTPPAPFDPAHVREGYTPAALADALRERDFEIVEMRFCMYGIFRTMMRLYRILRFLPATAIRSLSWADTVWPLGRPFDLLILARLPDQGGESRGHDSSA